MPHSQPPAPQVSSVSQSDAESPHAQTSVPPCGTQLGFDDESGQAAPLAGAVGPQVQAPPPPHVSSESQTEPASQPHPAAVQ